MADNKPRGQIQHILFIDCETSGLAFNSDDPSYNFTTNERYQAVSWGLIVVNANTLKPIKDLYVEIKYDESRYLWSDRAANIHGLSREHLEENGLTMEEAAVEIASLILEYWGPDSPVTVAGHNVATFDLPFLRSTLRSQGLEVKFANRHLDTWSVGFTTLKTFNSDDLFEAVGLPVRDAAKHNALEDAYCALETVKRIRSIYDHIIGE